MTDHMLFSFLQPYRMKVLVMMNYEKRALE